MPLPDFAIAQSGLHEETMTTKIRRVVTGHDLDGRSTFLIDAPTPHVFQRTKGSAIVHELWETTATPPGFRCAQSGLHIQTACPSGPVSVRRPIGQCWVPI